MAKTATSSSKAGSRTSPSCGSISSPLLMGLPAERPARGRPSPCIRRTRSRSPAVPTSRPADCPSLAASGIGGRASSMAPGDSCVPSWASQPRSLTYPAPGWRASSPALKSFISERTEPKRRVRAISRLPPQVSRWVLSTATVAERRCSPSRPADISARTAGPYSIARTLQDCRSEPCGWEAGESATTSRLKSVAAPATTVTGITKNGRT